MSGLRNLFSLTILLVAISTISYSAQIQPGKIIKNEIKGTSTEQYGHGDAPQSRNDIPVADECQRLDYNCSSTYWWRVPGMAEICAMRFSITEPDTSLGTVGFSLYEDQVTGNPDFDIFVWADDGLGYPDPNNLLYQTTIPFSSLVWYPDYVHVDLSAANLSFHEDFHVGWATNRTPDPFGYLAILMDNGTCGTDRSTIYKLGSWQKMADVSGTDYNFQIYADLCNLDLDSDGIPNDIDNCPQVANPLQEDDDNDLIGNVCDNCPADSSDNQSDFDEDGIGDICDNCPEAANFDQLNSDNDTLGNVCDNCPDIDNPQQEDLDGDNVGDSCDVCINDPDNDIDNDGYCGDIDNCPTNYNPDQTDSDGDAIGDSCDVCTDLDGDGYGDPGYPQNTCQEDNCLDLYNPLQRDSDGDGIGNLCDDCTDSDGDGFGNPGYPEDICQTDNCPDDFNPDQFDSDADGIGDSCDVCPDNPENDADNDGVCEDIDNCPTDYNPDQLDDDGDGIGNVCESGDTVFIDIATNGTSPALDTIYGGIAYEIRIWAKNTVQLGAWSTGFELWSDGNVSWEWQSVPGGWGPGGQDSGLAMITVVPGCRIDPPDSVWDMGGLLIEETDADGISPDTIMIGGLSLYNGPLAGPLEHMLSLNLIPDLGENSSGMICIDSVYVSPGGDFIFATKTGITFPPDFYGPFCWVVAENCGDANGDGSVNLGDAGYIINYIFMDGPAPDPLQSGDANCDGSVNLGDAGYIVNYIFFDGPYPCCP